ncbi:MAG: tyrosine--tRNA ligase [Candidatus Magasanikbacteria bacterium]|nr:tyrosine--tRNA ligase [Candidatus Magasanikbacteria bacterium]
MSVSRDPQKIHELLTRGVAEIYPTKEALEKLLLSGKRIRLYMGVDPTSPYLHIGHALQLRKMRQFQDLGHEVILLIGSFTGMIGDPTDKTAARKRLTRAEVMTNAKTYKKQASKILSFTGTHAAKVMFNDKWLSRFTFANVLDLAGHFTIQQLIQRDMFQHRLQEDKPISLPEFLYPLMQGYDSVAMNVDLEIGGTDQTFNMLAGRTLMKAMKNKEKFVMTLKLLTNDEGKKMSKTEGGFIALSDTPEEMFGKIMAMDDSVIIPYFELATDVPMNEIAEMQKKMKGGANPRDLKARLAHTVVAMYHSAAAADKSAAHFAHVFQAKEKPSDMPTVKARGTIVDVLVAAKIASSKSDARRLIEQGGVKVDDVVVTDIEMAVKRGSVIQKGKRFFVKVA